MEKLDDRGTIEMIQENVYMQFFVGLKEFTTKAIFDPSLFVDLRKRVGADTFDKLNSDLIKSASKLTDQEHHSKNDKRNKKKGEDQEPPNKGKLQMDATVADQYITFPTDSKILNESRKQCEKMIDKLYGFNGKKEIKPRTYHLVMATVFLDYSKKKKSKPFTVK